MDSHPFLLFVNKKKLGEPKIKQSFEKIIENQIPRSYSFLKSNNDPMDYF